MSAHAAERNLLTGFLALQMSFIDRGKFLAAMNAWLEDKSRPLTAILVAQQAISAEEQALLDALVQKHLERHHGDVTQSLAALSSVEASVVEELQSLADQDLERSLHTLAAQTVPRPELTSTLPPRQSGSSVSSERFRILRPHARGGLGEVFVAQDDEVPREVALKQIQQRHADDAQSRARFLLEAEITGGLEHPGIVPVYGLGTYLDGRPYYAMRFIRGDSLKEAIERFHRPEHSSSSSATGPATSARLRLNERARTLEFRKLLGRFVDVCQAIAYAHSRGVLHRDLKPGNIMLGKYGETLVVDWGLAKPQAGSQDEVSERSLTAEPLLKPSQSSGSAPTMAGEFLGTPGYASPEQASGRLDLLGPASDVYSLGGTLYSILTGRPPHTGQDIGELLRKITTGDIPRPQALVPDVPLVLQAICLKALALEPAQRYTSAQTLAEDVEQFLADEPVDAYREPWTARLRRTVRKRPSLSAGIAATLLVGLLTGSIFSVILSQQNQLLETANANLSAARDTAQANETRAIAQKKEADEQRQRAQEEQQRTQQALDFLVSAFRRADPTQDGRELKVVDLLSQAEEDLPKSLPDPLMQARVLEAIQATYYGLGIPDRSLATAHTVFELRKRTLGPDHPDTLITQNNLALAYRAAGQLSKALSLIEETLPKLKSTLGPDHPNTLLTQSNLALAYKDTGQMSKALPLYEETLQKQKTKLGPDHPDTLTSQSNLAWAYRAAGQLAKALPLFEETLQQKKRKLGSDHPDTLSSQYSLAGAYREAGQIEKAVALYEETLPKLKSKLGPDHPDTLTIQDNLAAAYHEAGQTEKAVPLLEETLQKSKSKLGPDHPHTLTDQNNLAMAYRAAGQLEKAVPLFEETLPKLKSKLGPDHPDTLTSQDNLAVTYYYTAQLAKAVPLFEETLQQRKRKLGPDHPNTLNTMSNLAAAYQKDGHPEKAVGLYERALEELQQKLGADHQSTREIETKLWKAYAMAGAWDKLSTVWRESYQRELQSRGPDDLLTIETGYTLSKVLIAAKKDDEAEPLLRTLAETCLKNAKDLPRDLRVQVLTAMWETSVRRNQPEQAAEWKRKLDELP